MIINTDVENVSVIWMNTLDDVFRFVAKKFDIEEENINVKLFRDGSFGLSKKSKLNGLVLKRSNGSYDIRIALNNRSVTEIAMTLIHEMTHVMQYVHKNLVQDRSIPYEKRWYEIEAFEMESKMLLEFMETLK
jgi:hypothetical protein